MPDSELMPIGSFARRSGLTASALRFYADSGLLPPAEIDTGTGYRFYGEDQLDRAVLLRRLREIDMPLTTVRAVLDADPAEAVRVLDEHVGTVVGNAESARRRAATIRAGLVAEPILFTAALNGPVLAGAIDQILTATTNEPDLPILGGVRFETDSGALTLTATDRYRLSTRTLVPTEPATATWAATVNADDLRLALPDLRRTPIARIEFAENVIRLRLPDRADHRCRLLTDPFPDHRTMLAALPPVTTRVEVPKALLLRALEEQPAEQVTLHVDVDAVTVQGHPGRGTGVPARVTGPAIDIRFETTTLYPAVATAIGADLLLDLRSPDQPATVRSADHGDLTTLVMPTARPTEHTSAEQNSNAKENNGCPSPATP